MTDPVVASVSTYNALFTRPDLDPYEGNYAAILTEFRCNNGPIAPTDLHNEVVANGDRNFPNTFLGLMKEDDNKAVYVLTHAAAAYPKRLGRPSPWDNKSYSFVGEVIGGSIPIIEFPRDSFDYPEDGISVNVPRNLDRALDLLSSEPDAEYIGPFQNNDANIRQARTRYFVPLPPQYCNIFLGQRLSIRDGFTKLANRLKDTGDVDRLPELVDWLLLSAVNWNNTGFPVQLHSVLNVPLADAHLLRHRRQVLEDHLPGLQQVPTTNATVAQEQMTTTLAQISEGLQQANDRYDRTTQQSQAPKSVEKFFGTAVNSLLALCNVDAAHQLQPIWHDLAGAGKQQRVVLRNGLASIARTSLMDIYPLATPDLLLKIIHLDWGSRDDYNFEMGIHPFAITLPQYSGRSSADAAHSASERSTAWDLINGGTTTNLSDATEIKRTKVMIPTNFLDGLSQLNGVGLLWQLLLGVEHPFISAYRAMLDRLNRNVVRFSHDFDNADQRPDHANSPPTILLFLRRVQVASVRYWDKALSRGELPSRPPDFSTPLEAIELRQTSWKPDFPSRYFSPIRKPNFSEDSTVSGLTALTHSISNGTLSRNSVGGTQARSTTDGAGSSSRNEAASQTSIPNSSVSSMFEPYVQRVRKTTITSGINKAGPPPKVTREGTQIDMCVSYHVKGSCWSACSRRADHAPHTAEEDAELLEWVKQAYPQQE